MSESPPDTQAASAATARPATDKTFPLPTRVRIEASSFCQLRCPSCPTTTRAIDPHVGRGMLDPEAFRRFLEQHPGVRTVELSNYGEPFLNPHLARLLEIAAAHDVTSSIDNGANLNNARPEMLEAIVRHGVQTLRVSIDGATQETYERYRVRGDLARVLDNIRLINDWKNRLASKTPHLIWQMILFEHNRHEVNAARALAKSLSMEFALKLSWDEELAPRDYGGDLAESLGLKAVTRSDFEQQTGKAYLTRICHQLWLEPAVNWDGKMLGCCRNFWGDFGANVFRDGLQAAVNHEKYTYARAMLQGQAPPRDDIPCSTCELYEKRRESGRWVKIYY